tara:strand:- start:2466 stop:2792 length:327 start_codon:yes stop_codon:yes gene_type:complete
MLDKIITLHDELRDQDYVVPQLKLTFVGRHSNNEVRIPDSPFSRGVSNVHCSIYQEPGKKPYVKDCESTNGTFVRGKQIHGEECASLFEGDELGLGDYKLIVHVKDNS